MDLSETDRKKLHENFLKEPDAFYEKASMDLLRNALKTSYTERFLMTTKLYKIGQMLANAKIEHKH